VAPPGHPGGTAGTRFVGSGEGPRNTGGPTVFCAVGNDERFVALQTVNKGRAKGWAPVLTEAAFATIYVDYVPAIRRYLARRVEFRDVDDLAADVFAIGWRKRHTITEGAELPWLYKTASYVVANYRRKKNRSTSLLHLFATPDTSPSAEDIALVDDRLAKAWRALSGSEREILSLVVVEDLAVSDAAVILRISANAASLRILRAKKHLVALLGDDRKDFDGKGR